MTSSPSSDTTPLLSGQHPPRSSSIPTHNNYPSGASPGQHLSTSIPANTTPSSNNNANGRHWSEETEDILGPDPSTYGHQNTGGAGYRRRSGPPPPGGPGSSPSGLHSHADLDAQRFFGQDRPTGLKRIFFSCCCFPCRRAYFSFQNKYSKTEKKWMAVAALFFLLSVCFLCAYVRAREEIPASGKNVRVAVLFLGLRLCLLCGKREVGKHGKGTNGKTDFFFV